MRNRRLHDALRAFALDAARVLSTDIEAGHEVQFELDERSTGRSVLYRYRPLINSFISDRWQSLQALQSFAAAAEQLGSGSAAYLRVQGLPADADAEPALLAMLERIWEDATSFGFPEDRFERVYADVERALYEGVLQTAIAAPLPGLVMERDRVEMGEGLALVRGDLSGAPPEAVWPNDSEIDHTRVRPHVVALLEAELAVDAPLPVPEARWRLRRLVMALRLWRSGSIALPATGWARADEGPWRQVALQPAPPARGGAWALAADEEDGFRQFADLVAEWDPTGPVGWALARFDMGCERGSDAEALSDYLLALRGLLDALDEAGQPTLARRLSALCAEEPRRAELQRRVDAALALELALTAGIPIDVWSPPPGVESGRALVGEIEEYLRDLLRDVVCGYLKPDLAAMADDILGGTPPEPPAAVKPERAPEPVRIAIRPALRDPVVGRRPEPVAAPAPEPEPRRHLSPVADASPLEPPEGEPTVTRVADPWRPITEVKDPARRPEQHPGPAPRPAPMHDQPSLVVDDFAWDLDEPEDYSAPV